MDSVGVQCRTRKSIIRNLSQVILRQVRQRLEIIAWNRDAGMVNTYEYSGYSIRW